MKTGQCGGNRAWSKLSRATRSVRYELAPFDSILGIAQVLWSRIDMRSKQSRRGAPPDQARVGISANRLSPEIERRANDSVGDGAAKIRRNPEDVACYMGQCRKGQLWAMRMCGHLSQKFLELFPGACDHGCVTS